MRKRKIFIASATETRESLAAPVARHLSDAGFDPVRWWSAFRLGDSTLERLQELAGSVDGAVFICLGTEKTWYRGETTDIPRDNVILELGLFLQILGRRKAIVVTGPGVKLPSDLAGITHLMDRGDEQTTAERITEHFKSELGAAPNRIKLGLPALPIEVDQVIAEASLRRPVPRGWHQRSLYLGTEGARNWLAVSEEPTHLTVMDEDRIRGLILEATRNLTIRSFVSLGPGSAETDREIAINLGDSSISYFPVDISEGLLFHACHVLGDHVRVPLGILSDFEERMPFIRSRLETRAESPIMVGLLGNTLCNLDRFEATFMHQIQDWLRPGDYVLLHVTVAADTWEVGRAPLAGKQHTVPRRRFFAQGLARQLNVPFETVLAEYQDRIIHREGRSDVPEATSVDFFDVKTGTKIQNLRWYRWEPFLAWIQSRFGFQVKYAAYHIYDGQDRGEGVALLEKQRA